MYATVADLRGEGVPVEVVDDARATLLLEEASRLIDSVTGQFFEARTLVVRIGGRGAPSVYPPQYPIRIDEASDWDLPLDVDSLDVVGAPVMPGSEGPRVTRTRGVFHVGARNVRLAGVWGYTEPDGTPEGRTPLAIRRATLLLALRWLAPLGEDGASAGRVVVEEKTREQSIRYAEPKAGGVVLIDVPEVDRLLAPYLRASKVGGA